MRPILFPESATTFTTNGLGRLEAISGLCEREVNGMDEIEFTVSVDDKHFSEVMLSRIVVVKPSPYKSNQAYRIYKISKPIDGIVTVNAEHITYQLSFIPVMPYTADSCANALAGISTNAAETCPFTFSTDKVISANWKSPSVPTSARGILQGEEGSILQRFKGEYEYDNWNVSLKTHLGTDRGVVIRYGKNLIDLNQEENIESTYTGICPFFQQDDYVLTLPEKVLHSANASNFPYQRTLPVDLSDKFEDIPTEAQLRAAGNAYMTDNNIGVPNVSLEVNFVDLSSTLEYKDIAPLEMVELGDTVGVYFEKLGVDAKAEVVRTVYDFVKERYEEIEIGAVRSSLSSTLANQTQEIRQQTTWMEEAVKTATDMINGGLGGYIRTTTNSAGQPQEILIMDTPDIATATNVIRLNQNGIGFSTTGYSGPFNSAWTIDGTFDASVINVINLIASKVQAFNQASDRLLEIMSGYMDLRALDNGVWRQRVGVYLTTDANGAIRVSNGLVDENGTPAGTSQRAILRPDSLRIGMDENGNVKVNVSSTGTITTDDQTKKSILAPTYAAICRDDATNESKVYIDGNNANFAVPINLKGTAADVTFANDAMFMSKEPVWVDAGAGYVVGSDGTGAVHALSELKVIDSGNLNSYTTAGTFRVTDPASVTNCPSSVAGVLIVESANGTHGGAETWRYMRQIYKPLNENGWWSRRGTTSSGTTYTWTAWTRENGTDTLFSGTFNSTTALQKLDNGMAYKELVIMGRPGDSINATVVVPTANLTTSPVNYQIAGQNNYFAFSLFYTGNDVYMSFVSTSSTSAGRISRVYGIG